MSTNTPFSKMSFSPEIQLSLAIVSPGVEGLSKRDELGKTNDARLETNCSFVQAAVMSS